MQVLSVTSEVFPLVKTGGLADVTGALPEALIAHGVTMRTFVPGYPAVMAALVSSAIAHTFENLFGGPARIVAGKAKGLDLFVLDAPHLYDRPGNIYLGPDGVDWPDNVARFGAFAFAAAEIGRGVISGYSPDILHLHDWQAALVAAHTTYGGGPPSLITVHNIAFQGVFPAASFAQLCLPPQAFAIDGVEYYGKVSFLKGGLACADAISTVSPTYAREICTPEFGMGLDGLLRTRRASLTGIVNGIDTSVWNPHADKILAKTYSSATLASRIANKRELEKRFGLAQDDRILHGIVSRLTTQKGLDLLANQLDWLVGTGARLALIGTGDASIENAFRASVARNPGRIGAVFGYDEALSHLVQGGADTILVPSRFEPCGLTQLYGLRYGCIPVVGRTGGLADTVIDANEAAISSGVATGIAFSPIEAETLQAALERTHRLYTDKAVWLKMQTQAMEQDVSWTRSAKAYADLYRSIQKS